MSTPNVLHYIEEAKIWGIVYDVSAHVKWESFICEGKIGGQGGGTGDGELTREAKGDCNYLRYCKALVKVRKCLKLKLKLFGKSLGILGFFFQVIIMVSVPHCVH